MVEQTTVPATSNAFNLDQGVCTVGVAKFKCPAQHPATGISWVNNAAVISKYMVVEEILQSHSEAIQACTDNHGALGMINNPSDLLEVRG